MVHIGALRLLNILGKLTHLNSLTNRPVGRPPMHASEEDRKAYLAKYARERYVSVKKHRQKRVDHPSYSMWSNAKKRAKAQEVAFTIKLEDIPIPELCPLLQIPLVKGVGWYTDNSPTLDKIIPSLGYVPGNVQVISMRANRIKDNSSFQEFEKIYLAWKAQRDSL